MSSQTVEKLNKKHITKRGRELGYDPHRKKVASEEINTAYRIENILEIKLERSLKGDWKDETGKVYDAVGPVPLQYFDAYSFFKAIRRHLTKSIDVIVIDLEFFTSPEKRLIRNYLLKLKDIPKTICLLDASNNFKPQKNMILD